MLGKKALGAAAAQESLFIEDVFSTWLRTGTGADVTVTNNIDMTEGYLLWTKSRSAATDHAVYDSGRGVTKDLVTNSSAAETTQSTGLKAVSGTGYTIGSLAKMNTSSATYVDWVFRKAPKFFDVVTYTGNGVDGRAISHSLGQTPGMIIVKRTNSTSNWTVWHRSIPSNSPLCLNLTNASDITTATQGFVSTPTDSTFNLTQYSGFNNVNASGSTYVAYLFAHDAGGFGEAGDQSVVSCGSYTGTGTPGINVTLGWEPQWLIVKRASGDTGDWYMQDVMRGWSTNSYEYGVAQQFFANTSMAENNAGGFAPTSTGFTVTGNVPAINNSGDTYIYLAIRRGPMKKPTSGTQVYAPFAITDTGIASVTPGFPVDMVIDGIRPGSANNFFVGDRLRGGPLYLRTALTDAELSSGGSWITYDQQNSYTLKIGSGLSSVLWSFRRAPGFFDIVCYTGTGSAGLTISHNLGAAPGLIITKRRNSTSNWAALVPNYANNLFDQGKLEDVQAFDRNLSYGTGQLNSTPTANSFAVTAAANINTSGGTYVAYLFATLPGVQYINSYVGDGTTGRTINCGFSNGARFVCVKATSTTGSWWIFDSARGITSSSDPALQLNSTAAEVTSADAIDPIASGFIVNQEATCSLNASGVTYLVWAIA